MEEYKLIGKPKLIKVDGIVYEYQITKWKNGKKSIRFKGIVAYSEWIKIKEKLSKKYKWLNDQEGY